MPLRNNCNRSRARGGELLLALGRILGHFAHTENPTYCVSFATEGVCIDDVRIDDVRFDELVLAAAPI